MIGPELAKSKLEWALEAVRRGLLLSPLHHMNPDGTCSCGKPNAPDDPSAKKKDVVYCDSPGKHPILKGGYSVASKDEEQIVEWWTEYPEANIAIWPSETEVDVDLDDKHAGKSGPLTLMNHLDINRDQLLSMTYTVRTTTGGYHLHFRVEKPASNRVNAMPGIDIRAKGGYVLAPGSTLWRKDEFDEFQELMYEAVNDLPVAPLPDSLGNLVRPRKERAAVDTPFLAGMEEDSPEGIREARIYLNNRPPANAGEGGNSHTYITACHLRERYNLGEETALDLMLESGWNDRCDPPWDLSDLSKIVKNAFSYAKEQIGSMGGLVIDMAYGAGLDPLGGDSEMPKDFNKTDEEIKVEKEGRFRKHLHNEYEFANLSYRYEFIIDGWLPDQGYSIMLGKRSSGKTTVCLDMVMHIVNDCQTWHTGIIDKGWYCVYLAAEDVPGVKERVEAWRKHTGILMTDPNRFRVFDASINLLDPEEVKAFAEFIQAETKLYRKVFFVVDTWQRMTMLAESQSADSDMQKAIANLEGLCKSFNGPSIILAHPPKANSETVAGSMVIENSSQAIWQVETTGGGSREIKVDRIKGAKEGIRKSFKFEAVEIEGITKFGKQRSAVVAKYTGGDVQSGDEDLKNLTNLSINENDIAETVAEIAVKIGTVDPTFSKNTIGMGDIAKAVYDAFNGTLTHELALKWVETFKEIGFTKSEVTSPHERRQFRPSESPIFIALDRLREKSNGRVKLANGDELVFKPMGKRYEITIEKPKPGIDEFEALDGEIV